MPNKHESPTSLVTATITALSHDGRGITHIDGKTVFVDGALPNETVQFSYLKRHSKFDEAKTIHVLQASPERVPAKCAHFSVCGGCSLQHMASDAQINFKQDVLLEQLEHIGKITAPTILPPLTGPVWGYRRKARLGVRYVIKKGRALVGFREKNQRYLTDIQSCQVLHPTVGTRIIAINQLIAELEAYQHIPQIEVAIGDDAAALIIRHLQPLSALDQTKLIEFGKTHQLHIFLQPKGVDSIHLLWPNPGRTYLSYELPEHNLKLQFNPSDFTQVNAKINRQMINRAIELLEPQSTDVILDLFCGLGNFTLPLAKHCQKIVGIEGDYHLVAKAKHNAQLNQINNAEFHCANLAEANLNQPWMKQHYQKILIDPPRSGAWEIMQIIANFNAEKILYVSCNPATLARDAGELTKHGYQLSKTGVMDMFPHTTHVEAIALFEKKASKGA